MAHNPRTEPVDCLSAVLHELAGGVVDRDATLRHGEIALHELQRRLSDARAWAWSEFHRDYDDRWLPTEPVPALESGWDWAVPEWMTSPVEPNRQDWFVPPTS